MAIRQIQSLFPIVLLAATFVDAAEPDSHPLPRKQREKMTKNLESQVSGLTAAIKEDPTSVALYS